MKVNNRILIGIISISLFLRIVASIYLGNQVEILPGTYDQISYHNLALRVLSGHGFSFGETWWPLTAADAPTAHWSYLYTFYLVLIYALFGPHPLAARLIQAVLVGIFQPVLIYLIARRLFGEAVGLAAASITAIYIYFIYYSATLMTEPYYITALLGSLYFAILLAEKATQPDKPASSVACFWLAIGLGITLGIAILLRQLFLIFIPILFLWIWWSSHKKGSRVAILSILLSSLIIIGIILPFTIYNYQRFGSFVLINTNAGYAFYWANHPIYGAHFVPILTPEMGSYQSLIPKELHQLSEADLDRELLRQGIRFVIADPGRYILLSISRIPAFFLFWPSAESGMISNLSRVFSFALFLPFMIYGLLLALFNSKWRANLTLSSPVFLLLVFAMVYTAIHLLSWALIRYRLPLDAILLIFAGLGVYDLSQRLAIGSRFTQPAG